MAAEYAHLAIWLIGLFGIVVTVSAFVAKFVMTDSLNYDQQYLWFRKVPGDGKKKR
ncbi:hypothetical protein [Paenibacillus sp. NPDC058071]|uniref:hypothetical protein n=1 Tax=Paenibacillus sp. NPDC058071 TaxID=3346326 RepID=UPI0036D86EB0